MDLEGKEGNHWIEVSQWDTCTRHTRLALFTGPVPWVIPEDVQVRIQYRKEDGTEGDYDTLPDGTTAWTAKGNMLTLRLAPQVFTAVGKVILQASILQREKCLHTFTMEILVRPILEGAGGEPSDTYTYLTGILPVPETAEVGQYLRIAQVDNRNRVVRVEAADDPACDATTVYILAEGESLSDVPENATLVVDTYGAPDLDFGRVKSVNGITPDENGNVEIMAGGTSSWNDLEDKPFDEVELIPETALVPFGDGQFGIPIPASLKQGTKYTVTWNGTEYTATCIFDGESRGLINDGANIATGEGIVFVIQLFDTVMDDLGGMAGIAMDMGGAAAVTMSVAEVIPLDSKYLPAVSGGVVGGRVIKITESIDLSDGMVTVSNNRDEFASYVWSGGSVVIDMGGTDRYQSRFVPFAWTWNEIDQMLRAVISMGTIGNCELGFPNGTWTPPAE